jgi:hypothetical protein
MRGTSILVSLTLAALAVAVVPRASASSGASALYDGDLDTQDALARSVAAYVTSGKTAAIDLGNARFSGEWRLVADQMAILGLGQVARAHPALRARYARVMERAARTMMQPAQRAFATRAWHADALAHLGDGRGNAWLGWPDLALSMLRWIDPQTPFAGLNDRITQALARRLARAPHALIETYPGRSFPTDVAACAAAIALYDRATGSDHRALLRRWVRSFRDGYVDPKSGYLWQQGDARTGAHRDAPRGSGTAVSAYFLSFVDVRLSAELTDALARHERSILGFGAIREYAEGYSGQGDVDSGPVLGGVSVTATGFALGAARANGQRALFGDLLRTTRLFGVPATHASATRFATGGFFGNATLLAQLTARPSRPAP